LVGKRHQVYSGLQGAGVVMESITLIDPEGSELNRTSYRGASRRSTRYRTS